MNIVLRHYLSSDSTATLAVFRDAILVTAARDYSAEQVRAWSGADGGIDEQEWDAKRRSLNTMIAEIDGTVAGFSDVDACGYIDMMFVSTAYGRRGVGSALLQWADKEARHMGATRLTTYASETARPFFEAHGFVVEAKQWPIIRGVQMHNYAMSRNVLSSAPSR